MGHIYDNAYKLITDIRHGINEYSSDLVNGTDTSGQFANSYLLEKMNSAQRHIYNILMRYVPDEFITNTSITCTSSVMTLPFDFGRIIQLEDTQKRKIFPSSIKSTPVQGQQGSDRHYYKQGRTLILNKPNVTQTNTIKYYRRPRELHFGQAQSGSGAAVLRMEGGTGDTAFAKKFDDYYNGMIVENFTSQIYDTISDYTATNYEATVVGTHAENDYYGLVSEIPEEFHFLIAPLAIMLTKGQHPAAQELPTRVEVSDWEMMLVDALRGFAGEEYDVDRESIWTDFVSGVDVGAGINIPNQGYTIY